MPGAVGFSTSRTLNHRTASGDPTPSLRAGMDELDAIALGVADAGHGVVELISDFWPDTDGEFELVRTMVARSGVPLSLSLAQNHRHPEAWRDLLRRIEEAVADGLAIRAQVAPRPVGVLVGLQSSYHPLLALPSYERLAGLSVAEQALALRDADCRAGLLRDLAAGDAGDAADGRRRRPIDYGHLYPLGDVPDYEPAPEASVPAARRGPRASIRPRCRWSCWRRTTDATSSTPRSPTMPTRTSTPAGEMLAHPHPPRPGRRRRPPSPHFRRQFPDVRALPPGR